MCCTQGTQAVFHTPWLYYSEKPVLKTVNHMARDQWQTCRIAKFVVVDGKTSIPNSSGRAKSSEDWIETLG